MMSALLFPSWARIFLRLRSVAQPGSAPALGAGGPRFESLYSDQFRGLAVLEFKPSFLSAGSHLPVAQLDRAPAF